MQTRQGDADKLRHEFWEAMADSPFVFLQLDSDRDGAVPMTAQLDEDANSAIWFFTSRNHHLAKMGPATATFAGKEHDIFARFKGNLVPETSKEQLDRHWSNSVEAWFPGGKDDPDLLMLRMDLGDAEIWDADMSLLTTAKMVLGQDVRDEAAEKHVETAL